MKTPKRALPDLSLGERANFLLTNRIPRRLFTRLMGWYSRIENRSLTRLSIWIWQRFADDLRLEEAACTDFKSVHDCFTRKLRPDARPINTAPEVLISPCDAVVGEFGNVADLTVIQAKGFPYTLGELLGNACLAEPYRHGRFVTLRLKSSMYHHFHAPLAGEVRGISYISGDTWNVNPIALKKIERLFCRNERAVIQLQGACPEQTITLVPVAAILVASMRLEGLTAPLNLQYKGPNQINLQRRYQKGEPMGYFEHGSTIVLLTPRSFAFCNSITTGETIRVGQPLMYLS